MTAHIILLPERLASITKEIAEQKIEAKFFPAIIHHVPCTGIVRAHKSVIQYAKENDLEMVPIVEDDVKFTAPGAWDYFIKTIPETFDVYAAGISIGKPDSNNVVKKFAGAFCYIVHRHFYNTFLNFNEQINIATNMQNKGLFIVCNPMVAKTHDGFSYHRKAFINHDHYFRNYTYLVSK